MRIPSIVGIAPDAKQRRTMFPARDLVVVPADQAAGREHMKAFRVSNRDWPNLQSDVWTSSSLLLTFAFHLVPVVQRIEQGFPNGKMAFLQESADVVSSGQTAVSKCLE